MLCFKIRSSRNVFFFYFLNSKRAASRPVRLVDSSSEERVVDIDWDERVVLNKNDASL